MTISVWFCFSRWLKMVRMDFDKILRTLLLLILLSCAKSHMLSASRRQPHLRHVSAVDRHQTWSMDKS